MAIRLAKTIFTGLLRGDISIFFVKGFLTTLGVLQEPYIRTLPYLQYLTLYLLVSLVRNTIGTMQLALILLAGCSKTCGNKMLNLVGFCLCSELLYLLCSNSTLVILLQKCVGFFVFVFCIYGYSYSPECSPFLGIKCSYLL